MSKLSRRMRALKSQGSRVPDGRSGSGGIPKRPPILEDSRWAMSPLPSPRPQPSSIQNLLFLGLVVIVIVVMNAIFWGGTSDLPVIDPATGRQVDQWESWD